jgi:uncharacterized protein (TIGR02444 family)
MNTTNSDMEGGHSPFWNFSLNFYSRPRVAPACLDLQDNGGVDVNVLFYLLFLAQQGRQLDRNDVARIDAMALAWRDRVVRPLRTLRRDLKYRIAPSNVEATAALRTDVKRIELEAERIEQHMLERLIPASTIGTQAPSPDEAARANIDVYGKFLGGLPAAPVKLLLEIFAET